MNCTRDTGFHSISGMRMLLIPYHNQNAKRAWNPEAANYFGVASNLLEQRLTGLTERKPAASVKKIVWHRHPRRCSFLFTAGGGCATWTIARHLYRASPMYLPSLTHTTMTF